MLHPHADSDVFQRYTQFCARNVRLRFSADFAEAANANSVGTSQSAQMIDKLNLRSHSSQETEIKKLRKGLTFKAALMPSFYKELPPKVGLKKPSSISL
nr:protein WVD2-like 4 [Tanacetum cinerariifolium]